MAQIHPKEKGAQGSLNGVVGVAMVSAFVEWVVER